MRHLDIPGCWYLDALPTGEYAGLLKASHQVQTHLGLLPQPPDDPLWLVVTATTVFRCMGQGQNTPFTWEWDGTRWASSPPPCGVWALIYGADGSKHTARCAPPTGSQGWRYVAPDGTLVTGDATIVPRRGLNEWTDLSLAQDGSIIGGQSAQGFGACVWADGQLRQLHAGDCFNTRWKYDAARDIVCASFYEVAADESITGWIYWMSLAELRALPPVVSLPAPPVDVPAIGRPLWLGAFLFGDKPTTFPGNCVLPVVQGVSWLTLRDVHGRLLLAYVSGSPDGDVDALDRAVKVAQDYQHPFGLPVLAYWTRQAQSIRLPVGADLIGVEAYHHVSESLADFETRVARAVLRCPRPWLIAQCYTSNANNRSDLRALVPIYARLAKQYPQIEGILGFNAGKRSELDVYGWDHHLEVQDVWRLLADGIVGTPAVPSAPDPGPPAPERPVPTPVPPVPTRPAPPPRTFSPFTEVNMAGKIVALVGPGGKYARIDPTFNDHVHFDATKVGAHEQFEADKQPNGRYTLRAVAADVILSADNTVHGSQLVAAQFTTRARREDGNFPVGNYELWTIKEDPDSKLLLAFVRYTEQGAEAERVFAGGLLSVIEQ